MTTEEQLAFLTAHLNHVIEQLSQTQKELRVIQEELRATQEKLRVAHARIEEFTLHGLHVSVGEIVELLHRIQEHTQPLLTELKAQIRSSPAVQADETGWREDGKVAGSFTAFSFLTSWYQLSNDHHESASGGLLIMGGKPPEACEQCFLKGARLHQA